MGSQGIDWDYQFNVQSNYSQKNTIRRVDAMIGSITVKKNMTIILGGNLLSLTSI